MARSILSLLRPHQWSKNLLVFVPLVLAHEFNDLPKLLDVVSAFLSFSFLASAGYIVNDLADLEADRAHPSKRQRSIASGTVRPRLAKTLVPLLLGVSAAVAIPLGGRLVLWLLTYSAMSVAYTFSLKRLVIADVITLAGMYTVRLLAGGAAAAVEVSEWLLAFAIFLFLSLALAKRYGDLQRRVNEGAAGLSSRPYRADDLVFLLTGGVAAGYLSVLVFALYLNSDKVRTLYSRPSVLWLASPLLLYWISRLWLLAHRGEVDDDPILFATRDPFSYVTAAAVLALLLLGI